MRLSVYMRYIVLRTLTMLLISTGLTLIAPSKIHGCTPSVMPDLETASNNADVIFMGEVAAVDDSIFGAVFSLGNKNVLFDVTSTWKGAPESQIIVSVRNEVCGHPIHDFYKGEAFVVFADKGAFSSFDASAPSRTREAYKVAEDLAILGDGKPPIGQTDLRTLFYLQAYWSEVTVSAFLALAVFWLVRMRKM